MSSQKANSKSWNPRQRSKSRKRRALLVGVVAVVLGAFAVQSLWPSMAGSGSTHEADPEAVVGDAIAGMAYEPAIDPSAAIAQAQDALAQAEADARARVDAHLAQAQASVDAVGVAASGLAPAPAGYVPGADMARFVQDAAVTVHPFDVPDMPGRLSSVDASGIVWENIESFRPSGNSSMPGTGVDELDQYRGQLESYYDLLGQALEGQDDGTVDLVWATLLTLGAPLPQEPADPVGAGKALFPDEETAREAQRHADYVLDAAGGNLGTFGAELDRMIEVHETLLETVDHVLTQTPTLRNTTLLEWQGELQRRLAAIEDVRQEAQAEVDARADAALQTVDATRNQTVTDVRSAVDEEIGTMQAVALNESARLQALADQVQADARVAVSDIENGTQETLRVLAEIEQESGRDMRQMASIVRDASELTIADIEATADAEQAMLRDAARKLVTSANDRADALYRYASTSLGDLQGELDHEIVEIERARAFAQQRVDYVQSLRADAHQAAYDLAVDTLLKETDAHMKRTLEVAWDVNQRSKQAIDGTFGVVERIRHESAIEVPDDVEYILQVVEDYRQVPTPEREEAARQWEAVATTLTGELDGLLGPGGRADEVQQKILEATALVELVEGGLLLRGTGM